MPSVFYLGDPMFRALDSAGAPLAGGQLYTFEPGTSTPKASYTDSTGLVTNANPVVLDSVGRAEVWLDAKYKLRLDDSLDVVQWTMDQVAGVGFIEFAEAGIDEWTEFTDSVPSFVDATNFSVADDKRTTFQVNRRVRATVDAGTIYGRITASVFSSVTTVTVEWDSGSLDTGLTAVAYGFVSVTNKSVHWQAIDDLELDFSKKGLNDSFVAGTVMLFNQTAAPVGWTKLLVDNDKALRLTTGAAGVGGTVAFETAFAPGAGVTGSHVLTVAEIPPHSHSYLGVVAGGPTSGGGGFFGLIVETGQTGGGAGHTHTNSTDLDVQFVDVILASKD
jgi:hypothetical protein